MKAILLSAIMIGIGIVASDRYKDNNQNSRTEHESKVIFVVEEEILFVEGKQYGIAPVGEFIQKGIGSLSQEVRRCGEYFYTINYGDRQFIGFKMSVPETIAESGSITKVFSKERYRILVIVPDTYHNSRPTVEFTERDVIIRITKQVFDQTPCFAYQRII